ncbi:hypothetical protein J6590_091232 [Homalodisca vitripennis]|nr:hypothetical protein J6590_091232 [Homalodisca vitripennis]
MDANERLLLTSHKYNTVTVASLLSRKREKCMQLMPMNVYCSTLTNTIQSLLLLYLPRASIEGRHVNMRTHGTHIPARDRLCVGVCPQSHQTPGSELY